MDNQRKEIIRNSIEDIGQAFADIMSALEDIYVALEPEEESE